ncbi:MAG: polysaccharide biosynthesis tyrosine autokinase [Steroidobacteraceae bacterium]
MVIATDINPTELNTVPPKAAANRAAERRPYPTSAAPVRDHRLAKLWRDNGTLTEQDFKRVIAAQREHGGQFGDTALRLGLVTELDVRRALARQCDLPTMVPDTDTFSRQLVAAHQPFSARTEALRGLRSELLLRWFGQGHSVLAVAEARRQQGAEQLAANLAWLYAQLGQRTLLIDCNLRQPQQQQLFKLSVRAGLSDFLNGRCDLEQAITQVPGFNQLSIMFAGAAPGNPQELLSLESFRYLLATVSEGFDVVILAGPPLLECADMQMIAARAGGCVLSVRRHRTHVSDIEAAKLRLAPSAATLLGMVLEG